MTFRSNGKLVLGLAAAALAGALATAPATARAFCGFYVSGGGEKLYNNATMVVMMREGTRTVLSIQNNYEGPPKDFAMVVPVPVVLQKDNVKTLPDEVFDRVDRLAAPRLVEYWEQDPCAPRRHPHTRRRRPGRTAGAPKAEAASADDLGVTVEAEFDVGEYQVVILSAEDSAGLDTWLKQEDYNIPDGAEPLLRPYVEEGSKFFVAKVDVDKVRFENNQAMLSPLRFHYDADEFRLPVRLGLMNAKGKQDLIVHILAKGKRYEVANYDNVTIPTNIDVAEDARDEFGAFYVALFDHTLERHPGAVVTEYSWNASGCDPCPTPALRPSELMTLGADVLPSTETADEPDPLAGIPGIAKSQPARRRPPRRPSSNLRGFVLTRLHARYDEDELGEDLVFKEAPPIVGGRERRGADGKLELGAERGSVNNFQGRYAIRHPWKGPIECDNPVRGRWGGPPAGQQAREPEPARNLAFAPRGKVTLASMVKTSIPEAGIEPAAGADEARQNEAEEANEQGGGGAEDEGEEGPEQTPGSASGNETADDDGCGDCAASPSGGTGTGLLALVALCALLARRRRRC